jgi:hypothetical protein
MTIGNCPKCNSSCTVFSQGSSRCNQCGLTKPGARGFAVSQHKSYVSHSFTRTESISEEEKQLLKKIYEEKAAIKTPEVKAHDTLKVSIIMPTFKRSHTIMESIASILAQTYTNWELIVIDNEPKHTYTFENPKIRCYPHCDEQSASYARNQGVQYITGDLVCFFDDDDLMETNYLEELVKPFILNPNIKASRCLIKLVEGVVNDSYCTPTVLIRKDLATPSWTKWSGHDQEYFGNIIGKLEPDQFVQLNKILVRAYTSLEGGIRAGAL